jgi:antitoxin FitA
MKKKKLKLCAVAAEEPPNVANIYDAIRARFAPLGGVELPVVEPEPIRPIDLD